MVGGTQPQQELPQPPPTTIPAAAGAATVTSSEEEALKRNTDCVYFLASPLTCKKGAECEYRHSDIARVNPRDCWYWLNGNCLNPKCAFRHPPLDGLFVTQAPTPIGSSTHPSQSGTSVGSAPYSSGKQGVPCIFFQKGLCLKGDRCPFLHAPTSVNNKVLQGPASATALEPSGVKKGFGSGLEKCSQEQKLPQGNISKLVELSHTKLQTKDNAAPTKTTVTVARHVTPPSGLDDQPPRYRATNVLTATNGNSVIRTNHAEQSNILDDPAIPSRDADEFSREPSPGFDVLVDDELRDSDYYHKEDHYGRTQGHEGRNLNPMNDYDIISHSTDYDSLVGVEGYDCYERMQGLYGREQHRASSERILGGSLHLERRQYGRVDSPDGIDESDLRHRLSKHRRGNGLRSVISHDHARDNHADDRNYGGSRRDGNNLCANESYISNRFRGRIKLPGRSSSPVNGNDSHPEREMERGRNWGRLSPGQSQISTHQGRLRDRIKGRLQEDSSSEGRSFRGLGVRDAINENNDFAGPKSLAELKGGKNSESREQQVNAKQSLSLGKRKYPKLESQEQYGSSLSFEGPKPLSEILKRKRGAETALSGSNLNMDSNQKEEKESPTGGLETINGVSGNKEGSGSAMTDAEDEGRDGMIHRAETKSADSHYPLKHNMTALGTETEGRIADDTMEEDHDPEMLDQRDGEFDYEQAAGEEYNVDEAENAEAEDEYIDDDDDDDGDDFARKIGVMFS
ncbi:hypothetical protein NMG60_11024194 [Bertholletia excelsa]